MEAKQWRVDIFITEDGDVTRAESRLRTRDQTHLMGHGQSRRNPHDRLVPEIGDELAVARSLSELSHRLLQAAIDDIEGFTHERVVLDH